MDEALVYCPLSPNEPAIHRRTLDSILALEWDGPIRVVFGEDGEKALPGSLEGNRNLTKKYNEARDIALLGNYSDLFTIESDMIVPPDALKRLSAIDADVGYGLYISRHGSHPWLAFSKVTEDVRGSKSIGKTWQERRNIWGKVIETAGVGMGCTRISRPVLEAIRFRTEDQYIANDWYFAVDAKAHGFTQKHDLGLICGHIDGYQTYWPDIQNGYRVDESNKLNLEEMLEMADGKYLVLKTLSVLPSPEHPKGFARPGSTIDLDDDTAKILLRKRAIKPVEQAQPEEVKDYGTNN